MKTADFHNLIQDVLDASADDDPKASAATVVDKIGDSDLRSVLTIVLRDYLVTFVRGGGRVRADSDDADTTDHTELPMTDTDRPPRVGVPRKFRAFYTLMESRICVAPGEWTRFGAMGHEELQRLAKSRDNESAALAAQAAKFRRMDAALTEYGVTKVKDLPPDVVRDILR